jgi:hypothetical protein
VLRLELLIAFDSLVKAASARTAAFFLMCFSVVVQVVLLWVNGAHDARGSDTCLVEAPVRLGFLAVAATAWSSGEMVAAVQTFNEAQGGFFAGEDRSPNPQGFKRYAADSRASPPRNCAERDVVSEAPSHPR